jgi:protein-S-isoprenylcysteine O-methyltransferase Ste14
VFLPQWCRLYWWPSIRGAATDGRPAHFFLACGIGGLLWCVRDFYVAGKGTLAPWDPPQKLVVVGLYRFTRNPMYWSVLFVLVGWSVWFGSPVLAAYTVLAAVAFHLRVVLYEEPWLAKKHGAIWTEFAANVPRWLPRLRPWRA